MISLCEFQSRGFSERQTNDRYTSLQAHVFVRISGEPRGQVAIRLLAASSGVRIDLFTSGQTMGGSFSTQSELCYGQQRCSAGGAGLGRKRQTTCAISRRREYRTCVRRLRPETDGPLPRLRYYPPRLWRIK